MREKGAMLGGNVYPNLTDPIILSLNWPVLKQDMYQLLATSQLVAITS